MSDKWYISGPLGIGAAEPKRTLHIEGHEIHSGGTEAGLSFQNRQSPSFVETPTAGERWVWYSREGAARLWSGNDKLSISKEGNVGIGTSDSAAKLHISAGGTFGEIRLFSPHPLTYADFAYDGGQESVFWFLHYGADTGATHFRHGDKDLLVIKNNGNVGIGTNDPKAKLHINGDVHANKYCGSNTLVLNDYRTANPASNVYLYSPPNDRDSWLFLDRAGVENGSNWGIYHRQIDAPLNNFLPGNSIAFIGGGNSDLKAYVCLGDGSAYFKGHVGMGGALEVNGSLRVKNTATIDGLLTAAGATLHSMAIGVNPSAAGIGDTTFPWEYETVGTMSSNHNLRLHSYNWIVLHAGNSQDENGTVSIGPDGHWVASSRKAKCNIDNLSSEEAIERLSELRPVTFSMRNSKNDTQRTGFIAEECPVSITNAEHTMINPMDIIATLTKVVKQHQITLECSPSELNEAGGVGVPEQHIKKWRIAAQ